MNFYSYVAGNPVNLIDPFGLFNDHSLFDKGDCDFDYGKEDEFGLTWPYLPWAVGHFRDLPDIENAARKAIKSGKCNKKYFERLMHAGQDYHAHWKKGHRPWPFHGWHPKDWGPGHMFHGKIDDATLLPERGQAAQWTYDWVKAWEEKCRCKEK